MILRALRALGLSELACFSLGGNFGTNRRAIGSMDDDFFRLSVLTLSGCGCDRCFFAWFCAVCGRTFFTHRWVDAFFGGAFVGFRRMVWLYFLGGARSRWMGAISRRKVSRPPQQGQVWGCCSGRMGWGCGSIPRWRRMVSRVRLAAALMKP